MKKASKIKVSNDTLTSKRQMAEETRTRIETKLEIKAYLQDLKYAINNGAQIEFQTKKRVDENREECYTNQYTVTKLFPNENPADALKRELLTLKAEDYMQTVKDLRFPKRSEMREFGKVYNGNEEVFIRIRVELLGQYGNAKTFIMSFHFAEKAFANHIFPYREN